MQVLSVVRPACMASDEKVFGLSESQIARRVKVVPKPLAWPTGSTSAAKDGVDGSPNPNASPAPSPPPSLP